jgi:hypothetical protein
VSQKLELSRFSSLTFLGFRNFLDLRSIMKQIQTVRKINTTEETVHNVCKGLRSIDSQSAVQKCVVPFQTVLLHHSLRINSVYHHILHISWNIICRHCLTKYEKNKTISKPTAGASIQDRMFQFRKEECGANFLYT